MAVFLAAVLRAGARLAVFLAAALRAGAFFFFAAGATGSTSWYQGLQVGIDPGPSDCPIPEVRASCSCTVRPITSASVTAVDSNVLDRSQTQGGWMNVPAPVWCSKRRRDPSPLLRTCLINRPTYVTSCTWPLTIPMQERANCKHLRIRVHSRPLDECKNRLVNRWNTHETQSLARMKLPSQQQAAEFCWGAIQINGDGPERNEARLSSDQHEVESPHRSSFRIF